MARKRPAGSRRTRNTQQQESASEVDDIDDVEVHDDLEVVDDYEDYEEEPEPARGQRASEKNASGERTSRKGGRAKRTRSAQSGGSPRQSGRQSARVKTLTPEQIAAKKQAQKTVAVMVALVLLMAAIGYGAFTAMQTDPRVTEADIALRQSADAFATMQNALRTSNADAALSAYQAGTAYIMVPLLGEAAENPEGVEGHTYLSRQYVRKAYEQRVRFEDQYAKIEKALRQATVHTNLTQIRAMLGNIESLDDEELDELERLREGFCLNPLDPEGDANEAAALTYAVLIAGLNGSEQDISSEKARRVRTQTTDVQASVSKSVNILIGEKRFQKALDMINEKAQEYPDAALDEERERVVQSANKKWTQVKKNADILYTDGKSATNEMAKRKANIAKAISAMAEVIKTYGIGEIVSEAQELKRTYEASLGRLE